MPEGSKDTTVRPETGYSSSPGGTSARAAVAAVAVANDRRTSLIVIKSQAQLGRSEVPSYQPTQSVSQLFHGPAPRSPLHRLAYSKGQTNPKCLCASLHVSLRGAVRRVSCLTETETCLSETTLGWSVPLGWYLRPSYFPHQGRARARLGRVVAGPPLCGK